MEFTGSRFIESRFDRQRREMEEFMFRIYRDGQIGTDGVIAKKKLREIFLQDTRDGRLQSVRINELGWLMMVHDFVKKSNEHQAGFFNLNLKRLEGLLFKWPTHMEKSQSISEETLGEITDFNYVATVQLQKCLLHRPCVHDCFVCGTSFDSASCVNEHYADVHGDDFKLDVTSSPQILSTGKKLTLDFTSNTRFPTVHFTIRNVTTKTLEIDDVYLYSNRMGLISMKRTPWPVTIRSGDGKEFIISKTVFNPFTNGKYSIMVDFWQFGKYVEQYHFRAQRSHGETPPVAKEGKSIKLGPLEIYQPPREIAEILENNFEMGAGFSQFQLDLCKEVKLALAADSKLKLNVSNYVRTLLLMNHVEDCTIQRQLEESKLLDVLPLSCGMPRFYCLKYELFSKDSYRVLEEGDQILLTRTLENKSLKRVLGVICQLGTDRVYFETEQPLKCTVNWMVQFSSNRTSFRMEYRALQIVCSQRLSNYFVPTKESTQAVSSHSLPSSSFKWFNALIGSNPQQREAVQNIVNQTALPAPFILFGPPGTGKTSTLVEAIVQVWRLRPGAYILATATSNFACNELTERLLKVLPEQDVFRFFSRSAERMLGTMLDSQLLGCSNLTGGSYRLPTVRELFTTRVVVCTITTAGRLLQQTTVHPVNGHFQYVFIDESGAATEASTLIPIAGILTSPQRMLGSVVLCGDPKQLGPIVRSRQAVAMGLGRSMLERLMGSCELYRRSPTNGLYDTRFIVKLVQNYRSHESIIRFSNERFYEGDLLPRASSSMTSWGIGWSELPNRTFPVMFVACHSGNLARESNSPSAFNAREVQIVEYFLRKILHPGQIRGHPVSQSDIGIISPYRLQCVKLRQRCAANAWSDIEIGSVEAFQGREKPIVIVTTVRSSGGSIGFLDNVARLNVAMTRAKALLIVIGNPNALIQDENWSAFIDYCTQNGAMREEPLEAQSVERKLTDNKIVERSELRNMTKEFSYLQI